MRTVAVVGDSRGIGAALREQLLAQGVRVIGVSRTGVQREGGAHERYQSLVFDAVAHPCDLSGFTEQLDGLVYCPGTIKLKPLARLEEGPIFVRFRSQRDGGRANTSGEPRTPEKGRSPRLW